MRKRGVASLCVVVMLAVIAGLALAPILQQGDTLREQARAALSQTSGELRLAGLDGPVEVVRDRWGIPHIYAGTEHDLFFAQGLVAAQDRLWQLDLWRRIAEGKLAELLGPAGLERDTFARLLRYRGDWDAEWRSYGPHAREIVNAFVQGINAQIDLVLRRPDTLPIEFQLTGSRPGRWSPETVVGRMAGYVMTRNARSEVQRARLVARVGTLRAAALMPTDPPTPLVVPAGLDLDDITEHILDITRGTSESVDFSPLREATVAQAALDRHRSASGMLHAAVDGSEEPPSSRYDAIGSNDWVVSGKLTASGKPLLANDPHRSLMLPSLRYTVHLVGPGWNVIGAGEPALPGVAAGHNDRVAFGFTIVGIDQQDLYVERLDPANPDRYRYKGAWEAMRIEHETVHVKGGPDREIELRFTRHGPVLHVDAKRQRAYALRWVGSEPGAAGYLRSLMLDTARNRQDVQAAVSAWKVPSENIVYADVDGNIGWVAAGLAPVRRNWSGLLPVPGDAGEFEWDGFLRADRLPQLTNPASGFIATANHNILPPGYPDALGYEFSSPWRFARIAWYLGGGGPLSRPDGTTSEVRAPASRFTVFEFERIQQDELSLPATAITWALAHAMRQADAAAIDPDAARAAKMFAEWDGSVRAASGAAALWETWLPLLATDCARTFLSDADRSVVGDRLSSDRIISLIRQAGWTPEPQPTRWVDGSPMPQGDGTRDEAAERDVRAKLVRVLTGRSLGEAWRQMVSRQGADPAMWKWGAAHQAVFQHALAFTDNRKALMNLPPVPRGGDGTTVNATSGGARQTSGASYREVIDLADWDASATINVPGESGQPGSEHYADLLPLWAGGEYHQMAFSRAAVDRVAAARLRLLPAK